MCFCGRKRWVAQPTRTRRTAEGRVSTTSSTAQKWWNFSDHWLLEQYILTRDLVSSIALSGKATTRERLCADFDGNVNGAPDSATFFCALFSSGVHDACGASSSVFRKPLHVVDLEARGLGIPTRVVDLCEFIKEVNGIKAGHKVFPGGRGLCPVLDVGNPSVLVLWKASLKGQAGGL